MRPTLDVAWAWVISLLKNCEDSKTLLASFKANGRISLIINGRSIYINSHPKGFRLFADSYWVLSMVQEFNRIKNLAKKMHGGIK